MSGKSRHQAQQFLCEASEDTEKRAAQRLQSLEELRKASCKRAFEPSPEGMGGTLTTDGEKGHTKKTCQPREKSSRNGIHITGANEDV